jgi:hypothetical protein
LTFETNKDVSQNIIPIIPMPNKSKTFFQRCFFEYNFILKTNIVDYHILIINNN